MKWYVKYHQLISFGYIEENVNGISYDLTIDVIYDGSGTSVSEYLLSPGENVFIKTREELNIPQNILGRIAEKNSRMRQGLKVDGPHYQPGHKTYAFLRIMNVSGASILLSKGMRIAQVIFEQLTQVPEVPYNAQPDAAFLDEEQYRGLGNYSEEYKKQMKEEAEKTKEDIEGVSQKIYANVLTLMGVLVAIFTLLTINYQAFSQASLNFKYILVMNLSLSLCIVVMMGIILIFVNNAKNKFFLISYIIILFILVIATVGMCVTFF
ncbi:MAG: hypothetical protein LUD18_00210 [Lachnospiraceae bacterium]|nr:hypothetical protein [Lachnospiraceae bacterium]